MFYLLIGVVSQDGHWQEGDEVSLPGMFCQVPMELYRVAPCQGILEGNPSGRLPIHPLKASLSRVNPMCFDGLPVTFCMARYAALLIPLSSAIIMVCFACRKD